MKWEHMNTFPDGRIVETLMINGRPYALYLTAPEGRESALVHMEGVGPVFLTTASLKEILGPSLFKTLSEHAPLRKNVENLMKTGSLIPIDKDILNGSTPYFNRRS